MDFKNKLFLNIFLLLFLGILLFCTTKDGRITGFNPVYGNLSVTSQHFFGARIFLDYRDTGELTPAILKNVSVGRHVIHLFLSNKKSTPDSAVVDVTKGETTTADFEMNAVGSGDLEILTEPANANVFLDRLLFGRTPIRIDGVPSGKHKIQIKKDNFEPVLESVEINTGELVELDKQLLLQTTHRVVLLEHFSNVSCPPCPESDALVDSLAEIFGPDSLVVLGYHANWPSPSDPMYLAAQEDNDQRLAYYGSGLIPRAFIDGEQVSSALDPQAYTVPIDAHLADAQMLLISILDLTRKDSLIKGEIEIEAKITLPGDVKLQIALIEDEIDYDSPPGTNGQKNFKSILRAFYPDALGQNLMLASGQTIIKDFSFSLSNQWGRDLTVVFFLQQESTKKVLHANWSRL